MFEDRIDAGKLLAGKLAKYERQSPLVVALPRGGVFIGFPIAKALHAKLEVLLVRKLGAPNNPELGIGAIAEDGVVFWDNDILEMLKVPLPVMKSIKYSEEEELERRKQLYRHGRTLPLLTNKTVILVDDGLATGVTAHAAILSLKKHHPKKIIFVAPVCSQATARMISPLVDTIICLDSEEQLEAISHYYRNFRQVTDEEVMTLLHKANEKYTDSNSAEVSFDHKIVW